MNELSIGIFDSGLGGLTTVKKLQQYLPHENIIYFGDTYNLPYGDKSTETILSYARKNISFLEKQNVKLILVACGTVGSYINLLKSEVPMFDIIAPACEKAVEITKNNTIGVICTDRAFKSNSYKSTIENINKNLYCVQQACPKLVPLIENDYNNNTEILKTVLKYYLTPVMRENIDTLILGCTHYPVIHNLISEITGEKIKLINPSKEIIIKLIDYMNFHNLNNMYNKNNNITGKSEFYVSGDPEKFKKNSKIFLNKDLEITKIKL